MFLGAGFAVIAFGRGTMAHLSLSCLGPFEATLAGRPVTGFKSNKVRALLIYLAVEAERAHRREVIAGHLWAEWPDRDALSNLRYALSNLRRVIGDHSAESSFLLITRDTLQFNSNSDYWLDVSAFQAQTQPLSNRDKAYPALSLIEEAIALYQGCFLEGFSIKDSVPFEEWMMKKRRQLDQRLLSSLRYLAMAYEEAGQYELSLVWARRHFELDPLDETVHRQLIRGLALSGRRSAAMIQYETCRDLLDKELGVEPTVDTAALYEQIRTDTIHTAGQTFRAALPTLTVKLPRFIQEERVQFDIPVFVARKGELARLQHYLELAMAGRGQVALVIGEAGSGKTALIQEFGRMSQDFAVELGVAIGNCNAYTGIGDPYLPFREILEMLTGDVEAKWAGGAISSDHAFRLWNTLPVAVDLLAEAGQGLMNTFILGTSLLERVEAYIQWSGKEDLHHRLNQLVENQVASDIRFSGPHQNDLFEQYTTFMQSLAIHKPLLLLVDDLQWADLGSVSLLFHLGRHLVGSRILIVGAYRREEVSLMRGGERHPLGPVINEFQRLYGDLLVNIDQTEGGDFVDALLDSEPNQLTRSFRGKLLQRTRGHPLFTVELLRGMQERGELIQNMQGNWIEGPSLDWETLPARVEAAISERISRLDQQLRVALQVASVEGEEFTAEVVANVLNQDEREIVQCLSSDLDRRHRLVRPRDVDYLGERRISRYRFRNYLFQKYLYENMDDVERAYIHEDVGNALEQLYGDQSDRIDVQLAWHYQEAGIAHKAVQYLCQAGEKALRLSAYQESLTHLTKGLEIVMSLPDSLDQAEQELALQLGLGIAWQSTESARSPKFLAAYTRARELCIQTGKTAQLCEVVQQIAVFHFVGAEYQTARELSAEALILAHRTEDPILVAICHWHLGFISFIIGEHTTARAHLEEVISFYKPELHHRPFIIHGDKDAGLGALAFYACCLWCLGYPEQAMKRSQEALTLARELNHPFSLADVLCNAGCKLNEMRRDAVPLKKNAEELIRLGNEKVAGWQGTGTYFLGEALAFSGQLQEGMDQMWAGLNSMQSRGIWCYFSGSQSVMAQTLAQTGRIEEGLNTLAETLKFVEKTDERHLESELCRLQGELLLMQGYEAEAEASLKKAIEVARSQHARSWELRATTTLARLWQSQGKTEEARRMLMEIYDWFTEGYDTRDLIEAKTVLEHLS